MVELPTIPKSDQDLLAECDVETFRASGPGGQNVNRRETAVRIRHQPTGIVVTCQEERNQYRNKQIALRRLRQELERLLTVEKPRISTSAPRGWRERILDFKTERAEKKRRRRRPDLDEDT
jgi:peptide chain release factor 2